MEEEPPRPRAGRREAGARAVKSATFDLDPARAGSALLTFAAAQGPSLRMGGSDFAQGLEGALTGVELLAAEAGVIPYVTLEDGTKGVVNVGGARDIISNRARWANASRISSSDALAVQTLYLAAHGSARQAHGSSRVLSSVDAPIGFLPVVPLVVLGVAAIIATAAYATLTKQTQIECDAANARAAAAVKASTDLGMAALTAGQPIPDGVWQTFQTIAHTEAHSGWWRPYALAGGVAAAAGGAWWVRRKLLA